MTSKTSTPGEMTGRKIAAIFVLFFGVIMAVNFTMASFASSTFGGVVVPNSYVASQKYNDWLAAAREQAREEGRQEVIVKNRGFFDFGSKEPINAVLPGEFRGFGKGRVYVLDNGQQWEQTDAVSVSGVRRQDPKVSISPGIIGVWYMKVEGINTQAKVRRVK